MTENILTGVGLCAGGRPNHQPGLAVASTVGFFCINKRWVKSFGRVPQASIWSLRQRDFDHSGCSTCSKEFQLEILA